MFRISSFGATTPQDETTPHELRRSEYEEPGVAMPDTLKAADMTRGACGCAQSCVPLGRLLLLLLSCGLVSRNDGSFQESIPFLKNEESVRLGGEALPRGTV